MMLLTPNAIEELKQTMTEKVEVIKRHLNVLD